MIPADLRTARQSLGLTQTEAAALLPVDRVTWARWESGSRPMHPAWYRLWRHMVGLERIPFRPAKRKSPDASPG